MRSPRTQPSRSALRAGLVPLLVLTLAVSACGDEPETAASPDTAAGPPATRDPRLVAVDFERPGALAGASTEGAVISRDAARSGVGGLEVRPIGSSAYAHWESDDLGADHAYWSFRAWVRIVAWSAGESVDVFTVRNGNTRNNFDLFVGEEAREWQWDLYRENAAAAPDGVVLGQWYLVEAKGSFASSTSTAEVRIDGVVQAPIASPGQPPSAVHDFVLGSLGTTKTNRTQFDDVRIEVGDAPLDFLGPPAPSPPPAGA